MILEVHERIVLFGLLPKEGTWANYKELRIAKELINFSADEIEFYEIRNEVDVNTGKPNTVWNPQKAKERVRDIPISGYITSVIQNELAKLEKQEKINEQTASLYEKFIINYA